MATSESAWFKSSYSGTAGDNCIEVVITEHAVRVRDSKDTTRPHLTLRPRQWAQFVRYAAAS
ncbi:DUF397 domain-containing protein [Streptomyces sp. NPDC057654]|uniref:DUF397 domain-containing protein n=1 Tax=Streptomyces sp. NPDC057654 TaxID=3346196 RepID=UPI0036ADE185